MGTINNQILNFADKLIPISDFSKGKTAQIFEDVKNNNAEYFRCERNTGIGGGVIIKEEISFNEALEEVLGKEDVYCINKGVAKRLANAAAKATPGGVAKEDRAHTSSSQPLNLPHYHIEVNGTHNENGSHIFFPL